MANQALVVTRDEQLLSAVEAAAAAADARLLCAAEISEVRRHWQDCGTVLVGTDMASLVVGLALPVRAGLHVIGRIEQQVLNWSVPLHAPALLLPQQSGFLSSILTTAGEGEVVQAPLVRVLGGHGGAGATTFAAALAQCAASRRRQPLKSALVEMDRFGGGIELVFGAEQAPGWRWCDLASASGHVGDLTGQLPNVSGVDLVSLSTAQPKSDLAGPDAIRAIIGSLRRSHDFVILDAGCPSGEPISFAARTLLIVAADVKAVLSARARISDFGLHDADLVVRTAVNWRLDPKAVAETLGLPLAGVVQTERRISLDAVIGTPPGRIDRSALTKVCRRLLNDILEGPNR